MTTTFEKQCDYLWKFAAVPILCVEEETRDTEGFYNENKGVAQEVFNNEEFVILAKTVTIFITIAAAYLSYDLNKNEPLLKQVIFTIMAAIFSFWYLLYYFIVYVVFSRM